MDLINFFGFLLILIYQSIELIDCSVGSRFSLSDQIIVGRPLRDDSEFDLSNRIITIDDQGNFRVSNRKLNHSLSTLKSSLRFAPERAQNSSSEGEKSGGRRDDDNDDDDDDEEEEEEDNVHSKLNHKAAPTYLSNWSRNNKTIAPSKPSPSHRTHTAIGDHSLADMLASAARSSTPPPPLLPRPRLGDKFKLKASHMSRRLDEEDDNESRPLEARRHQREPPEDRTLGGGSENLAEPMIEVNSSTDEEGSEASTMMRTPLVGGAYQSSKQPFAALINGSPKYQNQLSAIFRVRRNKWSLLKFAIIAVVSIYLLICIKSLLFTSPDISQSFKAPEALKDGVALQGVAEHLPLLNPSSASQGNNDNNFQASPDQTNNKLHETSSQYSSSSKSPRGILRHGSSLLPGRRRKPILGESLEVKKKRIDEQLETLLPVVSGWGEAGKGVQLTSEKDKEKAARLFKQGAYNVYISDRISPNRTLRSVVAKECNNIKYNTDDLPNVSVIIIYTNEIFSALIRTIWSVINRTPKNLLREIILVDDFSDKDYLKQPLQDYIDVYLNTYPKFKHEGDEDDDLVKLIRLPNRLGLIKARLHGARKAKGDVLLFLDSHCEATDLWLEPLLQRIKEDNKVFICPVIDIINDKTLEYNAVDPYYFQLGGFDWTGHFTWINRRESDAQKEPTKATKSPTMAGGLFAVDRKYFFEVGSYDEDMQIWGGENLELSFRVWQCGGRVEIHPCSHVGHIFRDFHPYSFNGLDSHGFNTLRTVLVWMDEFSKYFFMSRPDLKQVDSGDLKPRLELRNRLKCKSFGWYLDNVYDKRKFIYDRDVAAYGWVKNKHKDLCIDVLNKHETSGETAGLYTCEEMIHPLNVTTNQLFSYTHNHEIRREEGCLTLRVSKKADAVDDDDQDDDDADNNVEDHVNDPDILKSAKKFHKVVMYTCEEPDYVSSTRRKKSLAKHKRQMWRHERVHPRSGKDRLLISEATGECLTTKNGRSQSDLMATKCDRNDPHQHWEFQVYMEDT